MKRLILLFSGLFLIAACTQEKTPRGIIENEKMIAVLTDVHLVDAYITLIPYNDSVLKQQSAKYYDAIYKKYKINRSDFDRSLKYYSQQPKVLDSMYSQVLINLTKKEKEQNMLLKKEKKQNKLLKKEHDLPQ